MNKRWKFFCGATATVLLFSVAACKSPTGGTNDIVKACEGLPEVRFSSFYTLDDSGACKAKMSVPYTDTYTVTLTKSTKSVTLYDGDGKVLCEGTDKFEVSLNEGQRVYLSAQATEKKIEVKVTAKQHSRQLPFEVGAMPAASSFSTQAGNSAVDPLQAAKLNYTKRDNTLYAYCNAPESISAKPEVINHCITRQDVSDKKVFFTLEHNSNSLGDRRIYYGYRVRNTGTDDAYVTVKNIGYQTQGSGCWHGEDEWVKFYNTNFTFDLGELTESQRKNFTSYLGFSGAYCADNFQPVTYRIPSGEYIYVLGGTTQDAFGNFNVGKTANIPLFGSCQNGAVLFEVTGNAEGAYYIYDDYKKIEPGTEGGDSHLGITDAAYAAEHTGTDVGYVVDNSAQWTFNDATPSQFLPVTYTNYYEEDASRTGEACAPLASTAHVQNRTDWVTHINPQSENVGVGTDMTCFHTLGPDGQEVEVGTGSYDIRGRLANLGNWMKDYQDAFTFVNQGDEERTVTLSLKAKGCLAVMLRDSNGNPIEGSERYAFFYSETEAGDEFDLSYRYEVKIPAHSVKQVVLEYNLLANSYGFVLHTAYLT